MGNCASDDTWRSEDTIGNIDTGTVGFRKSSVQGINGAPRRGDRIHGSAIGRASKSHSHDDTVYSMARKQIENMIAIQRGHFDGPAYKLTVQ